MWTVAFHPDGKHLLGGTGDGVRRWRIADGEEVGRQNKDILTYAIAVSRSQKWMVCGTLNEGASVWDEETHEKVIHVEGTSTVYAVDVSPDSTRFATGINEAGSIWSITSGQRLVGPLKHDNVVAGIRFSPDGERVATVGNSDICIFDIHTGDELVTIKFDRSSWVGTALAWSSDGQRVFAASKDNTIRSFNTSTGSQLVESQILRDGTNDVPSLALAANSKFIATFTQNYSISFLDTSTLVQIGPVIEDSERIWSIAISLDSSQLATGQSNGKIAICDLSKILPDSYGPFHVSRHKPAVLSPPHQC